MRLLHTMIRVGDLDRSIQFYTETLGMELLRKNDYPDGKFTLAFLGYGPESESCVLELTHNWDPDPQPLNGGRNFGHLAYSVENIYATCQRLVDGGVTINRPPRDGYMAFVRSPDNVSVEILQQGQPLAQEDPWKSMPNTGEW